MEQLLAHLVGDYILQTDRMANLKTRSDLWAIIHGLTYTLPFLLIADWNRPPAAICALWVICFSHAYIDRYRLARYVVMWKNMATDSNREQFMTETGYAIGTPIWLSTWLLIIADNTIHLCINYAALRWI